jgi:hypothetical protein
VEVGVDGEALVLDPPLRFAIRPAALTVRVARTATTAGAGGPPTRLTDRTTITALFQLAFGRRKDTR